MGVYTLDKRQGTSEPLTEQQRAELMHSYIQHIKDAKENYYKLQPEECLLYPLLDPNVTDLGNELARGRISLQVWAYLLMIKGEIININSLERIGTEISECRTLIVQYEIGRIIYEHSNIHECLVPSQLIFFGATYHDGTPIVNHSKYDIVVDLSFDHEFDPENSENWGRLYISGLQHQEHYEI